jgi:DNA-binding ferritin-like protein
MSSLLNPSAKERSIAALSQLLPLLRGLANGAQVAHWRVRGPQFLPLHELFGETYGYLVGYADAVAERIAQLDGKVPESINSAYLFGEATQGLELCAMLGRFIEQVGRAAYAAMDQLAVVDLVFLAKLQDLQGGLEALCWKIEAHTK